MELEPTPELSPPRQQHSASTATLLPSHMLHTLRDSYYGAAEWLVQFSVSLRCFLQQRHRLSIYTHQAKELYSTTRRQQGHRLSIYTHEAKELYSTLRHQQNMVAMRLASTSQHRRDGGLFYRAGFLLRNAAPRYDFKAQGMREFFGGPTSPGRRPTEDSNDPCGLLGSRVSTEAQLYLTDFLLEPARLQYRVGTLVEKGMHKPILMTNSARPSTAPHGDFSRQLPRPA